MFVSIQSALATRRAYAEDDFTIPYLWMRDIPFDITLDNVFRFFNRVEYSDADRLDAIGYNLPSLSVDDLVTIGSDTYKVASCGFEKVDPPAPCGYCRRCRKDDTGGCLTVEAWVREQFDASTREDEMLREDEAQRNDPHYFDFSPGYATEMDYMNAQEADDYRDEF
jgi:hypothetical protein